MGDDVISSLAQVIHKSVWASVSNLAYDISSPQSADGGEASGWAEMVCTSNNPGQLMSHGCLGIGIPFAIGVQVANPDKRVVVIVGDGSVGFNIQEFDTMVRHNLPIVDSY